MSKKRVKAGGGSPSFGVKYPTRRPHSPKIVDHRATNTLVLRLMAEYPQWSVTASGEEYIISRIGLTSGFADEEILMEQALKKYLSLKIIQSDTISVRVGVCGPTAAAIAFSIPVSYYATIRMTEVSLDSQAEKQPAPWSLKRLFGWMNRPTY